MAENGAVNEQTITINGKEYEVSGLSDIAKSQMANIRYVDREIEQTKNQMAVLQAARQFYADLLSKELAKQ
ncbi:MAG: DUF6447 family protein [Porticoccaceae bacterium]|jgi:cell division protein ZapA (FtsZ GTPase activity inhibitor)|nr:DUF6447 family protein [Porticoccaceae bacterium]